MAATGTVDHAGSEDYDTLLFGAPTTLRQLTMDPELMDLAATLDDLGFDRQGLVDAAMLCGTDFNEGVRGIGPKTAVKAVREHGDLWGVLDARASDPERRGDPRAVHGPASDGRGRGHGGEPDVDAARDTSSTSGASPPTRSNAGSNASRSRRFRPGSTGGRERPEDRREHTFYFLVVRRVTYTCRGPRFDLGSRP